MRLKNLYLELTSACNLHCLTCDSCMQLNELNFDQIKPILISASEKGARQLYLTGGEPLVHKDIFQIIEYARSLRFHINMSCNGTLLDANVVERLLQAGLNNISLSLDGPRELNDYIRGAGVYDKVINSLKIFRDKKLSRMVNVLFTVSKVNYQALPDVLGIVQEFGVRQLFLNVFDPSFCINDRAGKSEIFLIPEQQLKNLEGVLYQSKSLAANLRIHFPDDAYLQNMIRYFKNEPIMPDNGCQIPAASSTVDASGQVGACWKCMTDLNIGSLTTNEIWDSKEYRQIVETAAKKSCPGCLFACYSERSI
ncbi:radical SAM protein [Lacrimispora brassicae]